MATLETIRRLTVEGRTVGMDQVAADLAKVSAGQREVGVTAEGMATKTETSARRQLSAAGSLARLESRLDGVTRANRSFEASQRVLDRAMQQGALTQTRYSELLQRAEVTRAAAVTQAQSRMRMAQANQNNLAVGDAPERVKLTAGQVQGLGYQINDVATMLALGSSPFQVIASQAGQVVQVLGDGPGGMRGSLTAIGTSLLSLATPATAVVAALTAAGAATVYFGMRSQNTIKPLNEAMEAHRKIINDIAASYGAAIDAREAYSSGATQAFGLRRSADELRLSARTSLLDNGFAGNSFLRLGRTEEGGRTYQARSAYKDFEQPLVVLVQGLRTGTEDARAFVDAVSKIANANPTNTALQKTAKELVDLAKPAADAKQQLDALTRALDDVQRVAARERISSAGEAFAGFVPDARTIRQQIQDAYTARVGVIDGLQDNNPRVGEGLRAAAAGDLAKALAEVERQEASARQGRELDLRSIAARTVAERTLIEVERERIALSGENVEASERAARLAAAAARVQAEAVRSADDTLRSSQAAYDQAGLVGYAAGLASINERYREQIELADGSAAAVERLKKARALDVAALQMQTRRDLFQPQQDQLRQLTAEAGLIGANDNARRQALASLQAENDLRRAGIELGSDLGRSYTSNARALSNFEDAIRRQNEAWDDMKRSGESAIDSLVEGLASGTGDIGEMLKGIAQDFAKTFLQLSVANPLKNALLGTNYGTLSDLFGGKAKPPDIGMPGMQSAGVVQMNAGVVNIAGAGVAGLLAGSGASGAAAAINDNFQLGGGASGSRAYRDAIAAIESRGSGGYAALGPVTASGDRAYGRYQVMGANIGPWSEQVLGRRLTASQFMANSAAQDAIFDKIFGGYVSRFGERGAAQAWFGGPGAVGKRGRGDQLGTSVGEYGDRFASELAKLPAAGTRAADAATAFADTSANAMGGLDQTLNNTLLGGIGAVADRFVPGLGSVFQALLSDLSRVGGGGGGGGLFGALLGGGISAGTRSAILAGAPGLFADGGYTGHGRRDEPAGIVHRGEVVWSQSDISRAGGVSTVEAMRRGVRGYASGGIVGMAAKPVQSAAQPAIQIIDQRSSATAAPIETRRGADGQMQMFIRDLARDEMTTRGRAGETTLRKGFGVRPALASRG